MTLKEDNILCHYYSFLQNGIELYINYYLFKYNFLMFNILSNRCINFLNNVDHWNIYALYSTAFIPVYIFRDIYFVILWLGTFQAHRSIDSLKISSERETNYRIWVQSQRNYSGNAVSCNITNFSFSSANLFSFSLKKNGKLREMKYKQHYE